MALDKDYLNADYHYIRARRLGNRHDSGPLEVTKGGVNPLIPFLIWTVLIGSVVGGVVVFMPKLLHYFG